MARLNGQFLLLRSIDHWSGAMLQFVPMMTADDREYGESDAYTLHNGTKTKVIRTVADKDGLLSSLMYQVMGEKKVPAIQSLMAVMEESYYYGCRDMAERAGEEKNNLRSAHQTEMKSRYEELAHVQAKLQQANECEMEAAKTITALKTQLKAAETAAKMVIADLRRQLELYRPVADSTEAKPTPAEPQPEPVAAPTNGGNDESGNNGSEPSELPGNENDSDQM